MTVIGYTRVSTEEQARDGYGLGAQHDAIEAEAARRGWEVTWVEDGGQSGKSMNRPGLAYALSRLKTGQASGLVVSRLDRLSRSLLDFAGLIKQAEFEGWSLVSLDPPLDLTTPAGRMVAHVLASFAEFERELISQRIREGLAVARDQGVKLGGPRRMPEDVVNRILREHKAGATLHRIARGLNDDAVPTARGGKCWYAGTIRSVVIRPPRSQRLAGPR